MSTNAGKPTVQRIGVIEGPGWFDPTGEDLLSRHAGVIEVEREPLGWDGFDWSLTQMGQSLPYIERATEKLVARGCQVVVQAGPAFAYEIAHDLEHARRLQERIGAANGCALVLNGVAVLDALMALPTRAIAAACPYYDDVWEQWLTGFLERQGFSITSFSTFCKLGIFADQEQVKVRNYAFTPEEVQRCVKGALERAGSASGLLISGSGVRTKSWLGSLAKQSPLPLISADGALYQAAMRAAGLNDAL